MPTFFEENKAELDRVSDLVAKMNQREAIRFLTLRERYGMYARALAPALGIESAGKFVTQVAKEIHAFLAEGTMPEEPKPPVVVAPKPPVKPVLCDGCGGIGDTPVFLRWAKVAKGEAVTISVDESGKPASLHWLTPEMIVEQWADPWSADTSIKFELVQDRGDIHIRFAYIDGPGQTLGMAYLPNQSVEHMESGGNLSGDIIIDSGDRWTREDDVHAAGEHEVGHAIGLPHTRNKLDVMYAYSTGVRRKHSKNDNIAKTKRYPPIEAIAA